MRFLLTALFVATACGDVSSVECADGRLCPDGTTCEVDGDRCLVNEGGCGEFPANSPCVLGDGQGFCAAECEEPVRIVGKVEESVDGDVTQATIEGVDRPWMDATPISIGAFTILATPNDSDLVLRVTDENRLPLLTRYLTLGSGDFLFNENPDEPLRVIGRPRQGMLLGTIGETYDPANGVVSVVVVRNSNGANLANVSGELTSSGIDPPTPLYFDGMANNTLTATTSENSRIVFPNVESGEYELVLTRPGTFSCRAAGDAEEAPIRFRVEPGTLTNLGLVKCVTQ